FAEVKYLMHAKQMAALDEIPLIADEFREAFGRSSGGLLKPYRVEDAETVVVALGSVLGTIEEVVDGLRDDGVSVGALGITCFRPWPVAEVREALSRAQRVVVVEKAFAVGAGGIVGQNTRDATRGLPVEVYDVVAGLGGRPITRASLRGLLDDVLGGRVDPQRLHFLDLDFALVQRELERSRRGKRPGPHAEHMLRDIGTVASGAYE
ncbi:MAG: transketolase C-terminal domain-containing protein, partial [Nocardioides sp.]